MELNASEVISALEFLQNLAINPLQSTSSKHRSVLNSIHKTYFRTNTKSTSGKKRKEPPSKAIAPKPKRQRLSRTTKPKRSDKEENDEDEDDEEDEEEEESSEDDDSDDIEEVTDEEDDPKNTLMHGVSLIEDNASTRNIQGDSPSHFSYFGENEGVFLTDKDALTPLWSHGEPRQTDLDNYLQSVSNIFYHPIEAMEQHLSTQNDPNHSNKNTSSKHKKSVKKQTQTEDESQEKILRYSTINLLLSPLRRRSPFDEWCPREVALFESAMCCKGKQFHEISKIIKTKNTKQCVEFYYFWKQSSHYAVWKALGRKTKKQLSKTQRKLHKRIGDKFAEFHSSIYSKNKKQMQSQDVHAQYNNSTNAVLVQQPQAQPQPMGIIGYYPQYYGNGYGQNGYCAQNGYPWYQNNNMYSPYQQYQPQTHTQSPNNNNSNDAGCGSNNGNSIKPIASNGNDDADFIDLTETASSNGENSASSKENSNSKDPDVVKEDKMSLKKHTMDSVQNINETMTA